MFWTDFGAVGIVLFGLAIYGLGALTASRPPPQIAAIAAVMVGAFSVSMTGATFFQAWWIATISMAMIALIAIVRESETHGPGASADRS